MDIYFILWVVAQLYFVSQTGPVLAISSPAFCAPLTSSPCGALLWGETALPYSVSPQDTRGLSCEFPAPVRAPAVSLKSPGSFYGRMVLETKIWVQDVFTTIGVSLLLVSLSR